MPTYNIVSEGTDRNGNTAIDSVVNSLVGSDTTIVFPSGTYKLNDLIVPSGTNNLELIAPNGARLVPGQSGDSLRWIDVYARGVLRNVEDGGFEYQLEERFYLDGRHGSETFHTLGTETREQVFRTDGGTAFRVKRGQVTVNIDFTTVSLGDFFGTQTPVVLAQPQTKTGNPSSRDWTTSRTVRSP